MTVVPAWPGLRQALRIALLQSAALVVLSVAALLAARAFPDQFFFFRAPWLLHPFEQEHLMIARHLAHTGDLTIDGEGLHPAYGSEDRGYVDGRYVPRGGVLGYLIYAPTFLISDSAWLWVTPAFGIVGALGACALVARRTGSAVAGLGAGTALYFAAPYYLASSGVAFENLIATALVLWAAVALDSYARDGHPAAGVLAGLLAGAAAATRPDYAPAAGLVICLILVRLAIAWRAGRLSRSIFAGSGLGAAFAAAGVASIFAANYAFTGDPLQSPYGSAWQGSASGIARNFAAFHLADFVKLARFFLWDVAAPASALFVAGLVLLPVHRRPFAGDVMLLGLALFLVVLHLGRSGLHATEEALLVSSPPRYLLPVYGAGIVLGFGGLALALRRLDLGPLPSALMLGVALVAASVGLNEAYTNAAGIPAAQGTAKRHLAVHEFSLKHPDALFLGDIDTSAIIVTQRLLIPRLLPETSALAPIVAGELASGRSVYVVDRPGSLVNNPLYSGYMDTLAASGLALCRESDERPFAEVVSVEGEGSRLVTRLSVRANDPAGVVTPVLRQGLSYYLVASGEFAYNAAGARSDAVDLWLDDTRMASQRSAAHIYCRKVQGRGAPVRLYVGDAFTQDNSGALTVAVWLAR